MIVGWNLGLSEGMAQFSLLVSGMVSIWPATTRSRAAKTRVFPTNKPHQTPYLVLACTRASPARLPTLSPLLDKHLAHLSKVGILPPPLAIGFPGWELLQYNIMLGLAITNTKFS